MEAQLEMQRMGSAQEAGFRKGLEDFSRLKTIMDQQLLQSDYSGWRRTVITFSGPLSIASTGAVSPNRDIEGNELQILHDPDALIQELLFGIIATQGGGAAVFLCRANEKTPQAFVECLLRQDGRRICSLIVQFAFAYIENTFFSRVWWDSLSNVERQHLTSLAWISNAYYEHFEYSRSRGTVPWEILDIQVSEE